MAKYRLMKFETIQLTAYVEADSVEDAIAKGEDDDIDGEWDETTLGTDGVTEVYLEGIVVWRDGEAVVPIKAGEECDIPF